MSAGKTRLAYIDDILLPRRMLAWIEPGVSMRAKSRILGRIKIVRWRDGRGEGCVLDEWVDAVSEATGGAP